VDARAAIADFLSSAGDGPLVGADLATLRIAKSKEVVSGALHALSYRTVDRHVRRAVLQTVERPHHWSVELIGISGGDPARSFPCWVMLMADVRAGIYRGGGHLIGDGAREARLVRLQFANGTTVEDTVEGSAVLFEIAEPVVCPAEVEILGSSGELLGGYVDRTAGLGVVRPGS
jgi:hypothetical protein